MGRLRPHTDLDPAELSAAALSDREAPFRVAATEEQAVQEKLNDYLSAPRLVRAALPLVRWLPTVIGPWAVTALALYAVPVLVAAVLLIDGVLDSWYVKVPVALVAGLVVLVAALVAGLGLLVRARWLALAPFIGMILLAAFAGSAAERLPERGPLAVTMLGLSGEGSFDQLARARRYLGTAGELARVTLDDFRAAWKVPAIPRPRRLIEADPQVTASAPAGAHRRSAG